MKINHDRNVTLINLFSVPKEIETEFVDSWHKTAEQMKQQPGFIDTKLHRNLESNGKFQFTNVAQWTTEEDFRKAQSNFEIVEQQLDIEAVPNLYSVEAKYKYN